MWEGDIPLNICNAKAKKDAFLNGPEELNFVELNIEFC